VQLGHFEGFGRQIYAQNLSAFASHRICKDAPSAANIYNPQSSQGHQSMYPFQAKGVYLVQGSKLTFRIPPAVSEIGKFGQFCRINI
jgi:hypothetical protein